MYHIARTHCMFAHLCQGVRGVERHVSEFAELATLAATTATLMREMPFSHIVTVTTARHSFL